MNSGISPDVTLTDGKISLRPYQENDSSATYRAVRESLAELIPWLPFAHPDYSIQETLDWVKQRPQEWRKGIAYEFTIRDAANGVYLGGCGINRIDAENLTANLGYWVRTSHTGRGTASAAVRLLGRHGHGKNWG